MKLKTYLAKANDDEIISICAKDGSSYVYIGEAKNVELINEVFEFTHQMMEDKLIKLRNRLRKLIFNSPKLNGDEDKDNEIIFEHGLKVSSTCKEINHVSHYLKRYKAPLEREIVTVEKRQCEEGNKIMVTGSEFGLFWFKSEFDKKFG